MYNTEKLDSPLGRAWAYHRDGRNDAAIAEFDRILKDAPNDVDAHFGLALVQRSLGRHDQAIQTLQKVKQLIERALQDQPGEDRWEMLARMCDQRIAEVQTQKGA